MVIAKQRWLEGDPGKKQSKHGTGEQKMVTKRLFKETD
jgi:hypothetical protein